LSEAEQNLAKLYTVFLPLVVMCCLAQTSQAAYIERTITIDGNMSDWYDASSSYTPPGDITNNPGQFSTDLEAGSGDIDSPNAGRDLKKFSFTWDTTNLYFYVERYASSANVTDWWFYLDINADGLMRTGEPIFHVEWKGTTRTTVADIYTYTESVSGGDILTGDGVAMPGAITYSSALYSTTDGSASGLEMESYISWATLGFGSPSNVKFHISSSNNTSSMPSSVQDNMDGPGGGSLFPQDLQITKIASVSSQVGNQPFSYTIQVYNSAIITFTNVVISDVIPAQTVYVSHTAEAGTTFDDSDSNLIPDTWNIPSIPANTTYTLTINVKAGIVPVTMTATNTAALTASDQTDEDNSNNSASVDVDIEPVPVLTMLKYTASPTVNPGSNINYSIQVTNTGGVAAHNVVITDVLSPFSMLRIDTYGASTPFQLTDGMPTSGMTLTGATITYSNDSVAPYSYTYTPVSGGGGAPSGYDANVTSWKIEMPGTMNPSNSNFVIDYQAQIH